VSYLARVQDRGLPAMLDAAMSRPYSASPHESFFTGGGVHRFRNFDARDDGRTVTVREAFQRSVNLVFIRLMRDLVHAHIYTSPDSARVAEDEHHPDRPRYLARFADREGRKFLERFYARHRGASAEDMLRRLTEAGPRTLTRLAVVFRSVRPHAPPGELAAFLRAHATAPDLSDARAHALYVQYDPSRWTLEDRGYLARVHPLELWLVEYLSDRPSPGLSAVLDAGAGPRQDAYGWLFRTTNRRAQDRAIRILLEADAFETIHAAWRRLGYPFPSLVPSYATAIGSSGDTPAALAELAGIILGDGVRRPSIRVTRARFGEGTPYDTQLVRRVEAGARVLSPEVASLLRRELVGVVREGTGRRLADSAGLGDGRTLEIGGKTGTGDNRFTTVGPSGRSSRVVNRTAAFVFTIGDRFFGTVIAFVPGREAASYDFTSALPVQILKHLLPTLEPLLDAPDPGEPVLVAVRTGTPD
jgi:membrane peptidoglycan carboxypeptidase